MSSFSRVLLILLFSMFCLALFMQDVRAETPREMVGSGEKVPRFVSLATDKAFVRTGPAPRYPIKWVYRKSGLPLEVVQEFDVWRKVRDIDGEEGWINKALLSSRRTAIIQGDGPVDIFSTAGDKGRLIARMEPGVVVQIQSCSGAQCRVSAGGYSGWVERKDLWGVYPQEEIQ
jgi:SH3-like domain-containing protein